MNVARTARWVMWAGLIALLLSAQVIVSGTEASAQTPVTITGKRLAQGRSPSIGFNSTSAKSAIAQCQPGQQALGGGVQVFTRNGSSPAGNVILHGVTPRETSVFAGAVEVERGYSQGRITHAASGNGSMWMPAINDGDPVAVGDRVQHRHG